MKSLLIIAHTPSPNTLRLAENMLAGARSTEYALQVTCLRPSEAEAQDVEDAQGLLLFTTENFGYMSGALKDFFDRTYYSVIDSKRGLPYALVVRAGKDGTGAKRSTESIVKGLGWKKVQEALVLKGEYRPDLEVKAFELAQAFSIGLGEGIF